MASWAILMAVALAPTDWEVRASRMEGAAASVSGAAVELARTARAVDGSGRFHGLAKIHGDALILHRSVASALLAAEHQRELIAAP